MEIILIILAFVFGLICGAGSVLFLKGQKLYSGTIHVKKTEDKIVYSLELEHDPEELETKKEVVFKVHPQEE